MVTRRGLLKHAGAISLGSLAYPALNAMRGASSAARASGASSGAATLPTFGLNDLEWNEVSSALGGGVPGKRLSQFGAAGVPSRWPRLPGSVRLAVVSSNPNMGALLSGSLDARLAAYARTVPAGQTVTVWHEGERRNLGISAKDLTAALAHAHSVMKRANPKLKFVQIITTYSVKSRGKEFGSYISPVVDAVYMDAYQHSKSTSIEDLAGAAGAAIHAAVGKSMPLGLAETNSQVPGGRGDWFRSAWAYAKQENYEICFTFWGDGYYWNSHDTSAVAALRAIMAEKNKMAA